jgi:uncharacterized protein (TIGR03086 family)
MTSIPDGIQELDRRAVLATVDLAAHITPADLHRATPCAGWNLADLLGHLVAGHRGFAAAAASDPPDGDPLAGWRVEPLGDDPVATYTAAAHAVLAAFAADGVLGRTMLLPEISPTFRFPAPQAISFHFIDYVVHGWDLARALDLPFQPDPELLGPALTVARAVPNGPRRAEPGSMFDPALAAPDDAPALDQILAWLGRSPSWPD